MITAIIPAKKGSTRCINKNIRDFSESNLLKMKIELLKKVKNLDKIIVSSNCDEMLNIASKLGVLTHKRNDEDCIPNYSGTDLYLSLAKIIDTEHMLLTFCVTPFVKIETYEKAIELYKYNLKNTNYDSFSSSLNFKHYIWHNNQPVNYDYYHSPPTQLLPDYYVPTYGINIIKTQYVINEKNVIGRNPYFYNVDQIESIDIDTPYDFLLSELLYDKNIINCDIAKNILTNRDKNNRIKLIDSTNNEFIMNLHEHYKAISLANYDYFEINNINNLNYFNYNGCDLLLNISENINLFNDHDSNNINLINNKINAFKFILNNQNKLKDLNDFYINNLNHLVNKKIYLFLSFDELLTIDSLKNIYDNMKNININGIIINDNGLFNEKNFIKFINVFLNIFIQKDYEFGIQTNNIIIYKLSLFYGFNLSFTYIGKDSSNDYLKFDDVLVNMHLNNKYDIKNIKPILKYYNLNIEEKLLYKKGYHPYFTLSNLNNHSNNFIQKLMKNKNSIETDFNELKLN